MNKRRWVLIFGLAVLAATAILSSSLHDAHFEPGRALPVHSSTSIPIMPLSVADGPATPLWRLLLFWAILLVNAVIFYFLLPPEIRKKILRMFIRFGLVMIALLIARHYHLIQLPVFGGNPYGDPNDATLLGLNSNADLPTFHPPAMTPWVTYLISLGAVVVLFILAWTGYSWWARLRARNFSPLRDIAEIAQASLNDLASGRDWGDVVVQSYVHMGEAVNKHRGLSRTQAMTPREFAARLEYAGLPAEAVKRLTRLFESVRYGARKSSQAEVNEAVACLNSILQACGAAQ
ncbi:MAG TPA: DUF4129 domain-containing protein [Anaerolineales bacterium]|nr:DUF4129 domain-containing protein [Anaerolineales bacterium]